MIHKRDRVIDVRPMPGVRSRAALAGLNEFAPKVRTLESSLAPTPVPAGEVVRVGPLGRFWGQASHKSGNQRA